MSGRQARTDEVVLDDLHRCFEGAVPAVVATADEHGTPNVTYLSRVRRVDDERVALSNQFFSKTARNLAANPRASLLLIDPTTYDEYRLTLVYERTERRGPVFERLVQDVDLVATLTGMEDVFKLRAADIYRVVRAEHLSAGAPPVEERPPRVPAVELVSRLGELAARLSRSADLDTLVGTTVAALDDLLGYPHSALFLLDEECRSLYTIASHGYPAEGVGSEVRMGAGPVGIAAERCIPVRIGQIRQMDKYARTLRRSFEAEGLATEADIPLPGLSQAQSRLAVPAVAMGQVVGVLMVDDAEPVAFDAEDESILRTVASLVAMAVEVERSRAAHDDTAGRPDVAAPAAPSTSATQVRFFPVDGSTFIDGDYLIKGVAGRILWSLLGQYQAEGRVDFTNREVRLDPSLELPQFRDNLESRLILLKRRLEERGAPVRLEKTGRGRFRLVVDTTLELDEAAQRDGS